MTEWRKGGTWLQSAAMVALGSLLSAVPPDRLSAQVGHDPTHSPFHDIFRGPGAVVFAGHLSGDRGRAGVGPANALTVGVRYELPAGRSMAIQFTGAYLQADRFIVNPYVAETASTRRTGPVDTDLLLTDIAFQLRLTGGKTWHGLAPYLTTGLGMAFDLRSPGDTTNSDYTFGSKFTVTVGTGARWHAARRLTVHADARAIYWRLAYPSAFRSPAPDGSRVVPLGVKTDWTRHPWISLGLGWTF
ncbi:MAG TPA: hypothetical protein VGQ25_00785 [Gemmatimonadales bacterium]|jgi:hypothetical protein|nr:hypothetical protein [Gemmatimonadales bacterium]